MPNRFYEYFCYSMPDIQTTWYALYCRSRFEKILAVRLSEKGFEAYAPVRKVLRLWSDRKKVVEEPLIRSYCFVKTHESRFSEVLNTPGAVRFVWFSGKPARIPEKQINILKVVAGSDVPVGVVSSSGLRPGMKVRVTAGPLKDIEGELIAVGGSKRVILRIDHIDTTLSLTISPLLLERVI